MAKHVLVLNGPNLNLLGAREPDVYGHQTLDDINNGLQVLADQHGAQCHFFQSNHEGALVDKLHEVLLESYDGVIYNPGAHTHYSYALRDAVTACGRPVIEVHLSNIYARAQAEPFRKESVIAPVCRGSIIGCGPFGYHLALAALERLKV